VSSRQLSIEDSVPCQISQSQYDAKVFRLAHSHILKRLRDISHELRNRSRDDLPTERRISLGEQFLVSDRELLQLIHSDTTQLTISLVATSALVYSHAVLRGISRSARLVTKLLCHLKNSIIVALTLPDGSRFSDPAVFPWALLIGVLASEKNSPNCTWFTKCLTQACQQTSLDWDQVYALTETPNDHPSPFHWVLEDEVVNITDVNTTIML
jgi:hypothetical protein